MPKRFPKQAWEVVKGVSLENVLTQEYTLKTFKELFEDNCTGLNAVIVRVVKVFPLLKTESIKKITVKEVLGCDISNVPISIQIGWAEKIDEIIKNEDIIILINPKLDTNPSIVRDSAPYMVVLDPSCTKKSETKFLIVRERDGTVLNLNEATLKKLNSRKNGMENRNLNKSKDSVPKVKVTDQSTGLVSGKGLSPTETISVKENETRMSYTLIKDLKLGSGFNLYGIVSSLIKPLTATRTGKFHAMLIIEDEYSNISPEYKSDVALHIFQPSHCSEFFVEQGDIVRVHHMKTEDYNKKLDGRVFHVNSITIFSSREDDSLIPKSSHNSADFVLTEFDEKRISELRLYLSEEYKKSKLLVSNGLPPWSKVLRLKDISGSGMFNLYCQILEIEQESPFKVYLRVQDGTFLNVVSREYYFLGKLLDDTCSIDTPQYTTNKGYLDIMAVDDAAVSIKFLKPGDYIYLKELQAILLECENEVISKPLLEFNVEHTITKIAEDHREAFIIDRSVRRNILDPLNKGPTTEACIKQKSNEFRLHTSPKLSQISNAHPCEVLSQNTQFILDPKSTNTLMCNDAFIETKDDYMSVDTTDPIINPINSSNSTTRELSTLNDSEDIFLSLSSKSIALESSLMENNVSDSINTLNSDQDNRFDEDKSQAYKIDLIDSYWRHQRSCFKKIHGRKLFITSVFDLNPDMVQPLKICDVKHKVGMKARLHCKLLGIKPSPPDCIRRSFCAVCCECQKLTMCPNLEKLVRVCDSCHGSTKPSIILSLHVSDDLDCINLFLTGIHAEKFFGCNWKMLKDFPSFATFMDQMLLKVLNMKSLCWLDVFVQSFCNKENKIEYHVQNSKLLLDRILALS